MKGFIPILLLFAGCSTVHKTTVTQKKTVDSAIATSADTSFKSTQTTRTDDLNIKDVDVTVIYGSPADSALAAAKAKPADKSVKNTGNATKLDDFATVIEDAVSDAGKAGNIASVTIHIGDISDSSTRRISVDTGSAHSSKSVAVKTQIVNQTKVVTRTGLPWYIYIVGGLIALFWIIYIIYRIYKKFSL